MDASVLVTGGAGGLGRAVTAGLLDAGWRVVVPTETEGELDSRANLDTCVADLTDPDEVARAVRRAAGEAGRPLRALVNLVGGFAAGQPVAETPLSEFERQFALNVRPTYLVTQAVLPHLVGAGGGSIVCASSNAALNPFAGAAGYVASKAAVLAFARVVAAEHAAEGVRCNALLPTAIDTPANRASFPPEEHHKLVPPERIAGVIRFLISDDSAAVNGQGIVV